MRFFTIFVFLIPLVLSASILDRRVKNIPKSSRLELAAVRELVLPEGASGKLEAADPEWVDILDGRAIYKSIANVHWVRCL
jgi:hypothetical protein